VTVDNTLITNTARAFDDGERANLDALAKFNIGRNECSGMDHGFSIVLK
jgi:hypothetical protein